MIRVVVDDLAFVSADAVLRPASQTLDPVSVAASRLDQMAGEGFAAQHRPSTPLEVGSAVVTEGGDLAADYVIHVVIKDDEVNPGRHVIQKALTSAWHRAAEWQLARVATPLVGSAVGQLSPEEAADVLKASLAGHDAAHPTEVVVVVDREADLALLSGRFAEAAR